jgi:nucleolar complex protein 2
MHQNVSYQLAFSFIRQLAIHLRNSLVNKTEQTSRLVYCWQYIHSVDFFSRMLSQHVGSNKSSPLEPLIHPLVQLILGTIKLNPSSQYFPLRFHLIESSLQLSKHTGIYVPIIPSLLEPLESALMKSRVSKNANSVLKPLDLEYVLRASSSYLSGPSSRVYKDQVATKLAELLMRFFEVFSLSLAFPELVMPTTVVIKRWIKVHGGDCGGKVRHALLGAVERLNEHAQWVEIKRRGLEFKPATGDLSNLQLDKEIADEGPLKKWIKSQKF